MNYEADVYWNRGAARALSQDSVILQQALTSRGRVLVAAVCDGMGGMDAGETASGYIAEELINWFYDGLLDAIGKKKPLWIIRRCAERKIYQVQRRIQNYADKRSLKMGSTMSMLLLWEKKYMLWHLGDSRIYRFKRGSGGRVLLMTKEHADEMGRLTKCIGSFGFFAPDFRMGTLKRDEAFLVCSDGFWKKTVAKELAESLAPGKMSQNKIRRRLKEIGDADIRRGERDDLSAVYIKVCR